MSLPSLGNYNPTKWALLHLSCERSDEFLHLTKFRHCVLYEPLLLWFVNGLWVVGANDGRVRRVPGGLPAAFGLVGVVGAFVTKHVADQEYESTQDGEDHHCNDTCGGHRETASIHYSIKMQNKLLLQLLKSRPSSMLLFIIIYK